MDRRVAGIAAITSALIIVAVFLMRPWEPPPTIDTNSRSCEEPDRYSLTIVVQNDLGEVLPTAWATYPSEDRNVQADANSDGEVRVPASTSVISLHASKHVSRVTEIPSDAEGRIFKISLPRLAAARFRVVHSDGAPEIGATVEMVPLDELSSTFIAEVRPLSRVTDRDGYVDFPELLPGLTYSIATTLPVGVATKPRNVLLSPGETYTEDLVVATNGVVRGRVLDESGAPCFDATVRLMKTSVEGDAAIAQEVSNDKTARDGTFSLHHNSSGPVVLKITWRDGDGIGRLFVKPLDISLEDRDIGDVVLNGPAKVRGIVTVDSLPVAGSRVSVWAGNVHAEDYTASDGTFELHVYGYDGTMQVIASYEGAHQARLDVSTSEISKEYLRLNLDSKRNGYLQVNLQSDVENFTCVWSAIERNDSGSVELGDGDKVSLEAGPYIVFAHFATAEGSFVSESVETFVYAAETSTIDVVMHPARTVLVKLPAKPDVNESMDVALRTLRGELISSGHRMLRQGKSTIFVVPHNADVQVETVVRQNGQLIRESHVVRFAKGERQVTIDLAD